MEEKKTTTGHRNLSPDHVLVKALCLDLDGTVRRSKTGGFIEKPEDIELMPHIEPIIWHYRQKLDHLCFGITNQAGVAHGFKLPADVNLEIQQTVKLFQNNPFNFIKTAMSDGKGTVEPFCHRSLLRKPDIGMLALLEVEAYEYGYIVDWDNSLFVGDRDEDEECAKRAGIKFMHINDFLKTKI
jgi:histidinol phosphatase-like enzyme